jgi:hypothetical protein
MRANGVPNFPDPSAKGSFDIGGQSTARIPIAPAAQAKCNKFVPGGGPPIPGTTTSPSPQTLAHWLKVAQCMRKHGVYDFPDPTTRIPSNLGSSAAGEISDRDGVILVFPHTIDQQSPQFTRAAARCAFRLTNH